MFIGTEVKWARKTLPKYAKENGIEIGKTYEISAVDVFEINGKLKTYIQLKNQKSSVQWLYLGDFGYAGEE